MANPQTSRASRTKRGGYVLLTCMLVVAISSSVVLGLFHMLRLQTAESTARRQMAVSQSLNDAAFEHAIAILLDQPNFEGQVGPIKVAEIPDQSYLFEIASTLGGPQVTMVTYTPVSKHVQQRLVPNNLLDERRATLGIKR